MLSEIRPEASFLPIWLIWIWVRLPKCDRSPRTGSRRDRHHPDGAWCRWQMAPRHPAAPKPTDAPWKPTAVVLTAGIGVEIAALKEAGFEVKRILA